MDVMDTECLQEEISVALERTTATSITSNSNLSNKKERKDGGGMEGSTNHCRGKQEDKGEDDVVVPLSRVEAAKRSLERAMNGGTRSSQWEGDGDLQLPFEVARPKNAGLTSSPSPSFKSSYAKSLADSYRRASIPVVVSSPKGQFYIKNDEILSLSTSPVRGLDNGCEKWGCVNAKSDTKTVSTSPTSKFHSLPPIMDSNEKLQEAEKKNKLNAKVLPARVFERLFDKDVFVPLEEVQQVCMEQGSSLSTKDWNSLAHHIISDGRKLVKLCDVKKLLKSDKQHRTNNGHLLLVNGSEKDSQMDNLQVEHGQLRDRVDQLCRTLAERDTTIQRLEEDLLRIRMECQRLLVDNRSLKSSLGNPGTSPPQPSEPDNTIQMTQLQQQVQLLTAKLKKAEQSRHTYEAATRQLVDFLHTVNSTLNNANHLNHSPGSRPTSPVTSPPCSLQSTISTTTTNTKTSSSVLAEADDDPPYRPRRSATPPPEGVSLQPIEGSSNKTSKEAMRKSGSVWALPTHNHNHQACKVSRAVSTQCVASASSSCLDDSPVLAGASSKGERTRSHPTDFLASRAKELLTSLKSLMRSDSVLKLNLEPKKSSSSVSGGKKRRGSKNTKVESGISTPSSSSTDTEPSSKTSVAPPPTHSSEHQDNKRPSSLSVSGVGVREVEEKTSDTNASPNISQSHDSRTRSTTTQPVPRIGTGKTREDTLQPQSSVLNGGNQQPLSLMVVDDPPCNPSDQRFSSLPLRTRITRTLTDADQRLVWV